MFDVAVVLILLPLALPLMALAATAILVESRGRGGILYKQTRIKQDNRPFQIYKFRSMVADAEKDGVARPEFVEQLAAKFPFYKERHRVKPGLTGWAQIRYPYGNTDEDALEKLQYDLYYVKNFSIFLDLLILLQTAEVVLLGKGAQ